MTTQSKGSDSGDRWEVREQAVASLPLGLFLASCEPGTFSKGGSRHTASWPEPSADSGQRLNDNLCSSEADHEARSIKHHHSPWLAEEASHGTAKEKPAGCETWSDPVMVAATRPALQNLEPGCISPYHREAWDCCLGKPLWGFLEECIGDAFTHLAQDILEGVWQRT